MNAAVAVLEFLSTAARAALIATSLTHLCLHDPPLRAVAQRAGSALKRCALRHASAKIPASNCYVGFGSKAAENCPFSVGTRRALATIRQGARVVRQSALLKAARRPLVSRRTFRRPLHRRTRPNICGRGRFKHLLLHHQNNYTSDHSYEDRSKKCLSEWHFTLPRGCTPLRRDIAPMLARAPVNLPDDAPSPSSKRGLFDGSIHSPPNFSRNRSACSRSAKQNTLYHVSSRRNECPIGASVRRSDITK